MNTNVDSPIRALRLALAAGLALLFLCGLVAPGMAAARKLRVVTTTSDLAALAATVGGDRVEVEALAKGYQDPHFVDAKPSFLVKLQKADLFVEVGRELEIGWAPGLLNNARNPKIVPGQRGHLDASEQIPLLEVRSGATRAEGDVHPFGNPHYWLDPENGRIIARSIATRLAALSPEGAPAFRANLAAFERALDARKATWLQQAKASGLTGSKVVTYHRSWSYFAKAFGFSVIGFVEPKPGIPPSAGHVQQLIRAMKEARVKLLIVEPYFDVKLPQKIARETGARLVVLAPSVGAEKRITSYLDLFDHDLALLAGASPRGEGRP